LKIEENYFTGTGDEVCVFKKKSRNQKRMSVIYRADGEIFIDAENFDDEQKIRDELKLRGKI
jgi:hypothetical protein